MRAESREFIVYACPVGPLNDQVEAFFDESRRRFGPNQAHRYMPHCTLTGFFHDDLAAVPSYIDALGSALAMAPRPIPAPVIAITGAVYDAEFMGFRLAAPWLEGVIVDFARLAASTTRRDALRLKRDLHLSLAYGFPPEQCAGLAALARESVDPTAPTSWNLRLYERRPGDLWNCLGGWPLG